MQMNARSVNLALYSLPMNAGRYSRQILFSGIGNEGQDALSKSRVTIIGCGALGSLQAEMLVRAGIGSLRIIDRDFVEESNLPRQLLFTEADAKENQPKAIAAARRLKLINSEIHLDALVTDVNYANIEDLIADAQIIVDGTDNFETRYLINDAAVKSGTPWVYGAAVGSYGVQMTIRPGITPCLRCIWSDPPSPGTFPTCDTGGVILTAIGMVASAQVTEALKLLIGRFDDLHNSLLEFDVWTSRFGRLNVKEARLADCSCCWKKDFAFLASHGGQLATTLCGRNAVQVLPGGRDSRVDLNELAENLKAVGEVTVNQYLLRLHARPYEITVFADGRGIIQGTEDTALARSLYSRYVGS